MLAFGFAHHPIPKGDDGCGAVLAVRRLGGDCGNKFANGFILFWCVANYVVVGFQEKKCLPAQAVPRQPSTENRKRRRRR